jgi:ADP-ribose pyrophosphatase
MATDPLPWSGATDTAAQTVPAAAAAPTAAAESAEPPIRLLARQLVFENTVLRVYADHVVDAHHEVPNFLTVVPRCITEDLVIGIAVLPVQAGKIGLLRVYRHALGRWQWEVPKGFIDAGESLELAAAREMREETGFDLPAERLVDLGAIAPEPGIVTSRVRLFLAQLEPTAVSQGRAHEMGHGDMGFFTRDEVSQMIRSNQIEDGCTQAIYLRYLLHPPTKG